MKLEITEKEYDYYNELDGYANGTFDDDGSEVEKGVYGEVIYKLNALLEEISESQFRIVRYEINIINSSLFRKLPLITLNK